ncbi:hypothetical protein JCM8097_006893 [Rhodosporidiobolus ruineniae]
MTAAMDRSAPTTKRSGLNRFNPKRLSFFNISASSSPAPAAPVVKPSALPLPVVSSPPGRRPSQGTKRKTAPSVHNSPVAVSTPAFFTNPSPFTSPPLQSKPAFVGLERRFSSENRAIAANRAKAIVAIETTPGKRRKSVVDLEEATEGMRTLSARRRSSLTPIQPLSSARRPSFVPVNSKLAEDEPQPVVVQEIRSPAGVPIKLPLPFPSARSPLLEDPTSPIMERRAAFSDEPASPILSSPPPPQSFASFASASSPSTSTFPSSSYRSSRTFTPRSPHAGHLAGDEDEGDDEERREKRGHVRTPSGVLINWPPVFPGRPSRPTSMASIDAELEAEEEEYQDEEEEDEGAEVDDIPLFRQPTLNFFRRAPPPTISSASPFPPPFLAPSTRGVSRDSFSNFAFPSMPTLFAQTPPAIPPSAARRTSTSSSYKSCGSVQTPSTFELHGCTPLATGHSFFGGGENPFSEAFGRHRQPRSSLVPDPVERIP